MKTYLLILGLGFMFLSMDEAAAIHEKIIDSAKRLNVQWLLRLTFMGSHRAWMVPYVLVGLVMLMAGYRPVGFVWWNFRREALWIATGLVLFGIGGIGLEIFSSERDSDTAYNWAIAAEEFLEMSGMSIVLYGFMLLAIRIQTEDPTVDR